MQIHRFRGRTLQEALRRAQSAHGDGAVVIGHESDSGGGVTVAVTEPRNTRAGAVKADAEQESEAPARSRTPDPGLSEVVRRMKESGASADLISRIRRRVTKSGVRGAYAIDAAAQVIGREFTIAPSPKIAGSARILTFVGPTGVGKTTTLAKLATQLVRGGRRIALATMDTFRVGAVEQLSTYADLLRVPLEVTGDARSLLAAISRHSDCEAILLDTTGRSPRDVKSIRGLAGIMDRISQGMTLDSYLVLAASTSAEAMDEAARGFMPCHPSAAVITKLDETGRPTPALEYTRFAELGTAFLCDGQDVTRHLHRPKPERFADLVLRGRMS